MTKQEMVNSAVEILDPIASQYKPTRYLYEVRISDPNHPIDEEALVEDGSREAYCEDCIEKAVQVKRKKFLKEREAEFAKWIKQKYSPEVQNRATPKQIHDYEQKLKRKYRKTTIFTSECYDVCGSETDDFESCEGCGVIFDQAMLLSEQELCRWEEMDNEELANTLKCPESSYILRDVLQSWYEGERYDKRIATLAQRLIDSVGKLTPQLI